MDLYLFLFSKGSFLHFLKHMLEKRNTGRKTQADVSL